jgi:SSS family solute:Na+ symporter
MEAIQIATLSAYIVAVLAIGLWTKRRETTGDFLIADRSAGVVLTTASLAAVVGGLVLASGAELSFEYGFGALWFAAGDACGLVFLGVVAGRIRSLSDEHGFLTLSDFLFVKFDARSGYLGSALQFIAFLFLLAAQFIVGGRLLAFLTPIDYPLAVILMGVVTVAYVLMGGFKAVLRTDLLQFAAMALVFLALLPLNTDFAELDLAFDIGSAGPLTSFSFFVSGFVSLFIGADIWQRVYSAKSGQVAKTSLFLAAALWLMFEVSLVIPGMAARGTGATAENALFAGLFEILPANLASIAVVGILAALMSTLDTEIFLLASMVGKDFVSRRRELTQEQLAQVIRIAMVGVTVPGMLIAIYWPTVLGALFMLLSLQMALFPAMLVSLFRPLSSGIAFLSMVIGSVLLVATFALGWTDPDTAPLVVLLGAGSVVALGLLRNR